MLNRESDRHAAHGAERADGSLRRRPSGDIGTGTWPEGLDYSPIATPKQCRSTDTMVPSSEENFPAPRVLTGCQKKETDGSAVVD